MGEPRLHPAVERQHGVEAGQDALVGVESGVGGVGQRRRVDALVGVAEQRRGEAGPAAQPGHVVEAVLQGRAVRHHPVVHLVEAGVQRRPSRGARRRLAVVGGEPHPGGGQAVEVRGLDQWVAGTPQAVGPELVERHEEHVHTTHSCSPGDPGTTGTGGRAPGRDPDPGPGRGPRRLRPWSTSTS